MGGYERSVVGIMNNIDTIREKISLISKSKGINKILFVCLGNLCRSPMAEYLLRDCLKKSGNTSINISSSGLLNLMGKRVPEEINDLMNKSGIDISDHRSSTITREAIMESDLIIVMELRQKEKLVHQFPECTTRIFLLSQLDPANPEERDIADPIGQTQFFYQNCFNDIKVLVAGLAEYTLEKK